MIESERSCLEVERSGTRQRYAILFSGSAQRRHLNGLEYCYRMLVDRYSFPIDNILTLYHRNELIANRRPAMHWPREPGSFSTECVTPLTLRLSGRANREELKRACNTVSAKLQPTDLVFIFICGHGDAHSTQSESESFIVLEDWTRYRATQFCDDLELLRAHRSLLVLMQQCYSGGFIEPIIDRQRTGRIKAHEISIACASHETSYATENGTFDSFAFNWITAHLNGIDTNGSGHVEASDAYEYAAAHTDRRDLPDTDHHPIGADQMRLA